MDLTERVAQLEADNQAMKAKLALVLEHMEFLEDSLDAHIARQEFKESGEQSIPFKQLLEEQGLEFLRLHRHTGEFAENKDIAEQLREETVRPAIKAGKQLTIDFAGVGMATQGFVHCLIADVIRSEGAGIVDQLTFTNCLPAVQSVVALVVDFAQHDGRQGAGDE